MLKHSLGRRGRQELEDALLKLGDFGALLDELLAQGALALVASPEIGRLLALARQSSSPGADATRQSGGARRAEVGTERWFLAR